MGGLAGHMNHLYDDADLTFSKMYEIILAASNGKLTAEEKVDGQNLFVSYNIKSGTPVAARNLTNIKEGGMDATALATKFAGRGGLTEAFVEAFATFERAVDALSPEVKIGIFGKDLDYWYNAEVMSPSNPNVIHYDEKVLKIHDSGHKRRNPDTMRPEDFDSTIPLGILDRNLEAMQASAAKSGDSSFVRSAIVKLRAMSDDTAANRAINRISSAIKVAGLQPDDTVASYLEARVRRHPAIAELNLPKDKIEALTLRTLGSKEAPNLRLIKKGLDEEQLEDVVGVASASAKRAILIDAIRPLEEAVHEFAVEMLGAVQSTFVLNPKKEVQRLRDTLSGAVAEITQLADDGVVSGKEMEMMRHQLQKIKDIKEINTTMEGIVFDYEGKVYKLTGSFAPVNQILGILTYSRGKRNQGVQTQTESLIDSMISSFLLKESAVTGVVTEQEGRRVALLPGGFKPPHAGHYLLAKYLSKQSDIDEVIIIVGKKDRCVEGTEFCLTAEHSKSLWELYFESAGDSNLSVRIQEGKSPVADVYDFIADPRMFHDGDTVILGKGEKDAGDTRFDRAQSYAERHNPGVNVEQVITPTFAGGVSGTQMRSFVANNDETSFKANLPTHLTAEEQRQAWNIVSPSPLEEISVASGVEGAAGAWGQPNNYDPYHTARKSGNKKRTSTRRPQSTRPKRGR